MLSAIGRIPGGRDVEGLVHLDPGGLDHAVEIRTVAINAGEVLIAVDRVDVPAVVNGVVG